MRRTATGGVGDFGADLTAVALSKPLPGRWRQSCEPFHGHLGGWHRGDLLGHLPGGLAGGLLGEQFPRRGAVIP
jgi:hypothetical protein